MRCCLKFYELGEKLLDGDYLNENADIDKIYEWFKNLPAVDKIILSLDTIAYGGLIP